MAEGGVTQKTATILAADVVGYTRLMADDEPATIDALDAARDVFIEHVGANQGRVVDTAGDSVLAVFETVAGAVHAAEAIQKRLAEINEPVPDERRMRFRIGIHLGDIHEKSDGTVYGDGVNVAARLESLADPGAIIVSDGVQAVLRGRLDIKFADAGTHNVKNVAEPVRAYRVLTKGEVAPKSQPPLRSPRVLGSVAIAILAVAGIATWQITAVPDPAKIAEVPEDPILALPSGPSIAVLPFDNMTEDGQQEYFADGLTEDIITGLSRFKDMFVVARNSTFQYKDRSIDVRQVGKELGVQYVLEGSVRIADERVRVTAQLLDARTGGHIWSDNYDRALTAADLFDLQDDIREHIVAEIAGGYGAIERTMVEELKAHRPQHLDAYACVLRARDYYRTFSAHVHREARDCLEAVVDPSLDDAEASAWLALLLLDEWRWGFNARAEVDDPLERAFDAARRSVAINPDSQDAQHALFKIHFFRKEIDQFFTHAERALAINPNNAFTVADAAFFMGMAGDWERGVPLLRKAATLNPNHPGWYHFLFFYNQYRQSHYERALAEAQKINTPGLFYNFVALAAAYGQLGRQQEAQQAIEALLELYPDINTNLRNEYRKYSVAEPLIEHIVEGLEKAVLDMPREANLPEAPPAPSRPVIAVLPFANMSGDPEYEFFADGIAEDIITRLARFPDLSVIARNSSFQYKGENVDIRTVANELGATYMLEGSVRRSESAIRVVAQLLDATDGTHLWAETYDRNLSAGSVFDIQDDITARVVGAIASADSIIAMAVVDASDTKAPADLASYECVLRAGEYWRVITPDMHLSARNCLEQVIIREPNYAQALAFLAGITIEEALYGFNSRADMAPPLDRALGYAQQAVDIDPKSGTAHWFLARTANFRHEMGIFYTEADRALELAPNDTLILASAGIHLAYSGKWERGMSLIARAIELNPHHQTWYHFAYFYDAYRQGLDETALAAAQRLNMPGFFWAYQVLAAVYAQLGMADEATSAVATLRELYPGYSIRTMHDMHRLWNFEDDVISRMAEGLRTAGLPEDTN